MGLPKLMNVGGSRNHTTKLPGPVRNKRDLEKTLWPAVRHAEGGGRIDLATNQDLKSFIKGKNSASPYEVMVLNRAMNPGMGPPTLLHRGTWSLGDRAKLDLTYGSGPVEKHTGVVFGLMRGDALPGGRKLTDTTLFLLDGKNDGPPFWLSLKGDPPAAESQPAWWDPKQAEVTVTARSQPDEARAQAYREDWIRAAEAYRAPDTRGG
jgi:hypothetical protein